MIKTRVFLGVSSIIVGALNNLSEVTKMFIN